MSRNFWIDCLTGPEERGDREGEREEGGGKREEGRGSRREESTKKYGGEWRGR